MDNLLLGARLRWQLDKYQDNLLAFELLKLHSFYSSVVYPLLHTCFNFEVSLSPSETR